MSAGPAPPKSPLRLGPVLGFRGASDDGATWRVAVLVAVAGVAAAPRLVWTRPGAAPERADARRVLRSGAVVVHRYDLDVARDDAETCVTYEVAGVRAAFAVPGRSTPLRVAYASCNGFSDPSVMRGVADRNERWRHLGRTHAAGPYHLLALGGDQIYADALWSAEPLFRAWHDLPRSERRRAPFTDALRRAARAFYVRTYLERWSQPEVADCLARIPALMMWDDHDVFDGWGSHAPEDQGSPVFQGVFAAARESFRAFQRMAAPAEVPAGTLDGTPGFTFGHVAGDTAILALDLRSERTRDRVMSAATWGAVVAWLDRLASAVPRPRHLLVMTSIPVVYPDLSAVEAFLGALPGTQELEDDLRDHWHSRPHKGERLRLLHRLFGVSEAGVRVTFLSGDVHVAAVGIVESSRSAVRPNAGVMNHLTSSAIVHPPPPALVLYAIERLTAAAEEADRGISTRLLELPGTRRRLLGARNWLAIEGDDRGRLWCHWHAEGEEHPYTKVVHPVG